jgi:peroxiredoxin
MNSPARFVITPGAALAIALAPAAAQDKKEATGAQVGKPAPDFTLKDTSGQEVKLASFKDKIVVLQWINPKCPVCVNVMKTGKVERMLKELKAAKSDIVWLPISSTAVAKPEEIAAYLDEHKMEAKGLMDNDGTVGHAYSAKTTPHLYVIDAKGVLRYDGAIDDDAGGKKGDGATNYAVAAVKAIVDGKEVSPATTKPYGCSVKYAKN